SLTMPDFINVSKPIAVFSSPEEASCVPSVVTFKDESTDATKWFWDFGDGSTSTLQNPSHIYATPGFYNVKLIVRNKKGCSDTLVKDNFIHVRGPVSSFKVSATFGCIPFAVKFTDASKNAVS